MPDKKSNHFVPRAHFKPFSLDGEGLAINLHLTGHAKSVRNASVSGQCAKDYYYGTDGLLEDLFGIAEGAYAAIIGKLVDDDHVEEAELEALRIFSILQYCRTEAAARRAMQAFRDMDDLVHEHHEDLRPELNITDKEMVLNSLSAFPEATHDTADLRVCILRNRTKIDFITCDDPVAITNRFIAQQRVKTAKMGSGTNSAGVTIYMPLTPRYALLCYDAQVYKVGNGGIFVDISKPPDAYSLNELQMLKARSAVYFRNWGDRLRVAAEVAKVTPSKPPSWHKLEFAALVDEVDGGKLFKVVGDAKSRREAKKALITIENIPLIPSRWCSEIRYRLKPKYYDTGTGAGILRHR